MSYVSWSNPILSIKKIKDVDGRLELVRKFPNNIKVFVDYAHTPDALLKVLRSLEVDYGKNISLVLERMKCFPES